MPHFFPDLWEKGGEFDVNASTLFDLASVTKAVATTTMAMILYERGLLELDTPIIGNHSGIPPNRLRSEPDPRRREVHLRMLLAHSSGLPAYEKLFLKAHSREDLLRAAFTTSLSADPGARAEYSDIGFILLGSALERIAGESLDIFCQREIFGPLAMTNTTFNPPKEVARKIPPTADEREESSEQCGAQHLPQSNHSRRGPGRKRLRPGRRGRTRRTFLHASEDLWRQHSARELPPCSTAERKPETGPILRPDTVALFTHRESMPPGTTRTLGWDTPSSPSQSGKYFGPRSFGHLGYTGTSLWLDPDRQLSITLLTNRTWPDCSNQAIKQVRPKFHDAVIEALHSD